MSDPASVEVHTTIEALPPEAIRLLDQGGLFDTVSWWRVVLRHGLQLDAKPAFLVVRLSGVLAAVIPMLGNGNGMTTPYTCEFAPRLAADIDPVAAMIAFGQYCRRRFPVTRLDAIPAEWAHVHSLVAAARLCGLCPLPFNHFGNWHEEVSGLGWPGYLARRPGALRETIRRRLRRAEALPDAKFRLMTRPEEIGRANLAFEAVYARSWKKPEPFPSFNTALMRAMAEAGALRFGLWSIGDAAAAVQIWCVRDGRAIVLKLAHDEAYKAHSPGTVLTALMVRHLLDQERVTGIDFGRGDDPYKQGWASQRRQRIGLLLANPWRPAGIAALARHAAGQARNAMRRR